MSNALIIAALIGEVITLGAVVWRGGAFVARVETLLEEHADDIDTQRHDLERVQRGLGHTDRRVARLEGAKSG